MFTFDFDLDLDKARFGVLSNWRMVMASVCRGDSGFLVLTRGVGSDDSILSLRDCLLLLPFCSSFSATISAAEYVSLPSFDADGDCGSKK